MSFGGRTGFRRDYIKNHKWDRVVESRDRQLPEWIRKTQEKKKNCHYFWKKNAGNFCTHLILSLFMSDVWLFLKCLFFLYFTAIESLVKAPFRGTLTFSCRIFVKWFRSILNALETLKKVRENVKLWNL